MGFCGSTYSMQISTKDYSFGFVNKDEAHQMATDILKKEGIEYNEEIIFIWDGTL